MPNRVLVGDYNDEPHVLVDWCMEVPTTARIADVKQQGVKPAIFPNRWQARRFVRSRDSYKRWRVIREDRL